MISPIEGAQGSRQTDCAQALAARVREFVLHKVVPYEKDPRWGAHGPSEDMIIDLQDLARAAELLTPQIRSDGSHLSYHELAPVLRAAGLSPLGPLALNVAAPDEGNMYLIGKIGTADQKRRFLEPLVAARMRSAFFMAEPAASGGAGSDPSMMITVAKPDADYWVIEGRKAFITGALGAGVGIIMAKTGDSATMFLVDLPNPAVRIERVLDTLDGSMPGGHALVRLEGLRVPSDQILGKLNEGFKYAQVRLAPARLTHCMRWLGAAIRCHGLACDYAVRREAFGKKIIEHEGVGFMLADNAIDLKQSELMIDWCAKVIDTGASAITESSMTKVAVSEALFRVADRCVQVMGGTGLTRDTIVERVFREIRAFRIYDGPSEVHRWSIAKTISKDTLSKVTT
jgi:acyl-CoA dehydrogenase